MNNGKAKRVFDFSLLNRVFSFAAPYKRHFYVSIFLTVLLAALSPLRPYLIQLTVDKYISSQWMQMLITITIIQIGVLLVETCMRFFFTFMTNWLGQSVIKDLRVAVYRKVRVFNVTKDHLFCIKTFLFFMPAIRMGVVAFIGCSKCAGNGH